MNRQLTNKARQAVAQLRDFARAHGMSHFQRDPLVMAIHDVLDAVDRLKTAEGSCGWCGKPALCSSCDYKKREAERQGNADYYEQFGR